MKKIPAIPGFVYGTKLLTVQFNGEGHILWRQALFIVTNHVSDGAAHYGTCRRFYFYLLNKINLITKKL